MRTSADVVKFYQTWYGLNSRSYLPTLPRDLVKFVASHAIPATVLPSIWNTVRFAVEESRTGYTDGSKVVLPSWYFNPVVLGSSDLADGFWKSIALVNGTTLHECLHVYQNRLHGVECSMKWMAEQDERLVRQQAKHGNVVYDMINIVEDIYIEATQEGRATFDVCTAKNIILLPAEKMDSFDADDGQGLMAMITTFKNPVSRFHDKWEHSELTQKIQDILLDIVKQGHSHQAFRFRLTAAADIIDLMAATLPEMPEGQSQDQESYSVAGMGKADGKRDKKAEQAAAQAKADAGDEGEGESDEEGKSAGKPDGEDSDGEGKGETIDFEGSFILQNAKATPDNNRKSEQYEWTAISDYAQNVYSHAGVERWAVKQETVRENIRRTGRTEEEGSKQAIVPDVGDLRNAVMYMDRTTKLGTPERTGLYFSHEHAVNLWSDQRVMHRRNRVTLIPMELVFLLDGSGSMTGSTSECLNGRRSLVSKVLATAERLHESLMGIPHMFCMHTTAMQSADVDANGLAEACLLVDIDGYDMFVSDLEDSFKHALRISHKNNADGVAITAAGKKFRQSAGKKVMFVLSDGAPNAHGYDDGMNHTKQSVEELRLQGIKVFGVALVPSVISANEQIYGAEYTIDASGDVTAAMEQALIKVVSED